MNENNSRQELKLLIIDDDKIITDMIERVVTNLRISVRSTNDSKQIEQCYKNFEPDVIFLDLGLPGFDGTEVLSHLASFDCDAKISLISGLDRLSLENCQAAGVDFDLNITGALTKPFTREDILFALEA